MNIEVIEVQGRSHTLTQTDGGTFRINSRDTKSINEELVSPEFYAEQAMGNIILKKKPEDKKTHKEVKNNG